MRDFFKLKAWFIFLGIAITAVSFSAVLVYRDFLVSGFNLQRDNLISRNIGNINYALADTSDNVSGFAWSENIGWISFNSTDCDSDCSGATCTSDGSPAGCPAIGTTYSNYGVKIDGITGNFSGYAWSSNVGWISFNRSDTANPPSNDPGEGSGPIAVLNLASEDISGWAKILSLGDDGWIRFDHGQSNPVAVDIDGSNGGNSGDFYGWAYNEGSGGGGIGWISFNNCDILGSCPGIDYEVAVDAGTLNQPPSVSFDMPADAITYDDLCINPLAAYLRWTFHDAEDGLNNQTNCEVQIKKSTDAWTTLVVDYVGVNHTGEQYAFNTNIDFNTAYNWRVKVYDSGGLDSGWKEFNDLTDNDGDSNFITFTTYTNDFPDPYFTWTPREFSADEDVKFIDGSTCYDGGDCSNIDWEFSGTPASFSGNYYDASNTIASFPTVGEWTATSTITDSNGYSCSTTTKSEANLKLPNWIESR